MKITHYEKLLRSKELELQASLARLESEGRASGEAEVKDYSDNATSSQSTAEFFEEGSMVSQTLQQVRDALRRLQSGSYGRCTVCERQIESARLEAVPWTPHCLKHQEQQDARQDRS
jgi:DnaK suppressor protein